MEQQIQIVPQDKPQEIGMANFYGESAIRFTFNISSIEQSLIAVFPSLYVPSCNRILDTFGYFGEQTTLKNIWERIQELSDNIFENICILFYWFNNLTTISRFYLAEKNNNGNMFYSVLATYDIINDTILNDFKVAALDVDVASLLDHIAVICEDDTFECSYEFLENAPITLGVPSTD